MSYQGDIAEDQPFSFHFTTRKDTGLPTTLSGSPVLSVYKDNNLVQTTTGPTLTVDADGITGYNRVDMVTTDAFYVASADYTIVITTGTVNSISVIGEVVATFSIDNRGLLRPSVAGRKLGVEADGDLTKVNLCAVNTDMVGTDDAALASALSAHDGNLATVDGKVSGLNDFDAATETVDVGEINGNAVAAIRLALSAGTIVIGAAETGTLTTTEMTTNLTEVTPGHYNGRIILWTSGALNNQGTDITAYSATGKLTYTAVTEAPDNGDTFIIV